MFNILMADKTNDVCSFWLELEPITTDDVVCLSEKDNYHSWSLKGKDVVWFPELKTSDIIEYMCIYNIIKHMPFNAHLTNLFVDGDEYGLVTNVVNFAAISYVTPGDQVCRDLNSELFESSDITSVYKTAISQNEPLSYSLISFSDDIEKMYDWEDMDSCYLLTKVTDTMSLCWFEYVATSLGLVLDRGYYYSTEKIVSCGEYSLVKFRKCDMCEFKTGM